MWRKARSVGLCLLLLSAPLLAPSAQELSSSAPAGTSRQPSPPPLKLLQNAEDWLKIDAFSIKDGQLDRFTLALKPTPHRLGSIRNRPGTELPPLAELPDYAVERLESFTAARRTLPRPW